MLLPFDFSPILVYNITREVRFCNFFRESRFNLQENMEKFIDFDGNLNIFPGERFVVAAGVFDGVHLGHQLIIRQAVSRAAAGCWL